MGYCSPRQMKRTKAFLILYGVHFPANGCHLWLPRCIVGFCSAHSAFVNFRFLPAVSIRLKGLVSFRTQILPSAFRFFQLHFRRICPLHSFILVCMACQLYTRGVWPTACSLSVAWLGVFGRIGGKDIPEGHSSFSMISCSERECWRVGRFAFPAVLIFGLMGALYGKNRMQPGSIYALYIRIAK